MFFLTVHQGHLSRLTSYKKRLAHHNMHTLRDRRWMADQIFLFKIVRGLIDCSYLLNNISFSVPRRNARLANFRPFAFRNVRTNVGRNEIICRMSKEHNKLFSVNKNIDMLVCSLPKFKKYLLGYINK